MTMTVAFAVVAALNAWHAGRWWPWLLGAAGFFAATGYFLPSVLRPLNYAWFRFGMLLHAVVNPVVMGLLFFTAIFPTALVMRIMGSNLLRLKRPDVDSYWTSRKPPGPAAGSMRDQF